MSWDADRLLGGAFDKERAHSGHNPVDRCRQENSQYGAQDHLLDRVDPRIHTALCHKRGKRQSQYPDESVAAGQYDGHGQKESDSGMTADGAPTQQFRV